MHLMCLELADIMLCLFSGCKRLANAYIYIYIYIYVHRYLCRNSYALRFDSK
jgi:hypothetical protein